MLLISISEKTAVWAWDTYPVSTAWEIGATKPHYTILWNEKDPIPFPYEKIERW